MRLCARMVAIHGAILALISPMHLLAQENAEALARTTLPESSAAAATEAPATHAFELERPTGAVLSIGHDTVAGARRYADRTASDNGVATVRFSTVRRHRAASSSLDFASLPVSGGRLTSGYGYRVNPVTRRHAFHHGVDLAVASGTPVLATAGGRIAFAGRSGGYGLLVVIDHGNGVMTRMGHLSAISVRSGETVEAGDAVGRSGSTGRATGPHVHYEIRVDGGSIDPLQGAS